MKRILFPSTNRVHYARQQILLEELSKEFDVVVEEYQSKYFDTLDAIADYANHFRKVIEEGFDLALVRGDRFEMLPIAMLCAYRGVPIAHIEGGDLSGAIDNKVRHAITQLADIHFATNEESQKRIIGMGVSPSSVFDYGSLDTEFARSVLLEDYKGEAYILVVYHPLENEDVEELDKALKHWNGKVVRIQSNKDSGKTYGNEEYLPEEYINLMAHASCLVGNSSSFLKEASVFGTPVVNIGERQHMRYTPNNVINVPVKKFDIKTSIAYQVEHGRYAPSDFYYKENTSRNITNELKKFLKVV